MPNTPPRYRPSTILTSQKMPAGFNYTVFLNTVSFLDMSLREALKQIKTAMLEEDENKVAELTIEKRKRTEALMVYLEAVYKETNGEISRMPAFDPEGEHYLKLAIEDEGQGLWFKIKHRGQQARDRQTETKEEILDVMDWEDI